jgi:hypothetical protein
MYADLFGSSNVIEKLHEVYDLADEVFIYPLSEPKNLPFKKYKNIGFAARRSNKELVPKIREKYLRNLYRKLYL